MAPFRPLTESEISHLPDEDIVAYHSEARAAGQHQAGRAALSVLAHRWSDRIGWWGRKAPQGEREELIQDVLAAVLTSTWDGESLTSFGAWLRRITQFKVVDIYRGR